jgi:hypothetical protein
VRSAKDPYTLNKHFFHSRARAKRALRCFNPRNRNIAQNQPHEGVIGTYSMVVNILLYSRAGICLASCSSSPMDIDIKERIAALCAKVIAAPDRSEEFVCAMEELNSALSEHAENLRSQIASLRQKGFPQSNDTGER